MSSAGQYEYVVVGSGAGGGTVAARLALAGHKVLLLEAGGDPLSTTGGGPLGKDRLPDDYSVPCFHTMATENEAMRWDFWVRHYQDDALQKQDSKYYPDYEGKRVDGVLYPRAGTLGGCTAHNAMIMVYPHDADWDQIAELVGDPSWNATNMRRYFVRLEDCRHRPVWRLINKLTGWNPTGHGFDGWLSTEIALPVRVFADFNLVKIITRCALGIFMALGSPLQWLREGPVSKLDPNDQRTNKKTLEGIHLAPLSTRRHARNGTREFLLDVASKHPDRLTVELNCLVTKVLFDESNKAIGVQYLKGRNLYRAGPIASADPGQRHDVHVSREVILSGGAFNTPQLLMLSGIGPRSSLEQFGIEVRVDLSGVGTNLQDRYEVGLVHRLKSPSKLMQGASFSRADPHYRKWATGRRGLYISNGIALAAIKRSAPERKLPDLLIFGVIGYFRGYFPKYSNAIAGNKDYFTLAILKAHTENQAGTVTLKSSDPRDPPAINFRYFSEGSNAGVQDLESVVAGVDFVRSLADQIPHLMEEESPGRKVESPQDVERFVQAEAWGHHASCTCPIGPKTNPMSVLDSSFRVYGTKNLRVVDASVFPKIPGFFIVTSVYIIGEKASDAILEDTKVGSARLRL